MIWGNQRRGPIEREITHLWIDQHRHAFIRQRQNLTQDAGGNDAFVVVGNDESIRARDYVFENSNDPICGPGINWSATLAISSHHKLVVGDDPRLGCRWPAFIKHEII